MKLPCRNQTDLFFSEEPVEIKQAKAICNTCPNKQPCLERAMKDKEPFGVWGGSSAHERRRIKRWSRHSGMNMDKAMDLHQAGTQRLPHSKKRQPN